VLDYIRGQLRPGDAVWEVRIVLDDIRVLQIAAEHLFFENHGSIASPAQVQSCRQSTRSAPNDDDVTVKYHTPAQYRR
jgi:hypothetical protein